MIVWPESKLIINQTVLSAHYLYSIVYFISHHTFYFPHLLPSQPASLQFKPQDSPRGFESTLGLQGLHSVSDQL